MSRKILVAFAPALLEQLDFVASVEHRSRSDLVRECVRRYLEVFRKSYYPIVQQAPNGAEEIKAGPMPVDKLKKVVDNDK